MIGPEEVTSEIVHFSIMIIKPFQQMRKPSSAIWIASTTALGIAILPLSWYGYYQLLRIGIVITAVWMAVSFFDIKKAGWGMVFIAIAILFNPIRPIYFEKEVWQVVDGVCAVIYISGGIWLNHIKKS